MKKRITIKSIKERLIPYICGALDLSISENPVFTQKGNRYSVCLHIRPNYEIVSPFLTPADLNFWIERTLSPFSSAVKACDEANKGFRDADLYHRQQQALNDRLVTALEEERKKLHRLLTVVRPFLKALVAWQDWQTKLQKDIGDNTYRLQEELQRVVNES